MHFPLSLSLLACILSSLSQLVLPVQSSPTPMYPSALEARSLEERYGSQGTISSPVNGTAIMPGESFDFYYNAHSDYCVSSSNFTVWLLTSPSSSLSGIMDGGAKVTGWYFGRFAYSSYSNHYPPNPAPSQLTMPDFSKSVGVNSIGQNVSSSPMYLAVMEEWNACEPTIGNQFSLAANMIMYNATNASTSS
ncbi:hypothetical protein ACEPAI_8957 [Sanghuangporus weigelae]